MAQWPCGFAAEAESPFIMALSGPETAVLAVTRPVRPYKSATENRFTAGNAKGA
jgi:hypothetical protein